MKHKIFAKKEKVSKEKETQILKQKEILRSINEFFKAYKNKLENKEYLILYYEDKKLKKISLKFLKENFLHLIGLKKGQRKSAIQFYKSLEQKTLKPQDIKVGNFTEIKLAVYKDMIEIFNEKGKIAVYNPENTYQKNLLIDKGMNLVNSESKGVLGIRYSNFEKGITVPVSLLQQKLENISYKDTITDIVCMFEKRVEEEKYNKIVYNIEKPEDLVEEDKEIEKLLSEDLLKEIKNKNQR